MSLLHKANTLLRLCMRGDTGQVRHHLKLSLRRAAIAVRGGRSFIHQQLGFPFVCFPDIGDSLELYLQDNDDGLELALMQCWLRKGDAAIDAGANLGIYAAAAAQRVGAEGRIVAIEPSAKLAELIRRTAHRLNYGNMHVCRACIGDTHGTVDFFVAKSGITSGEQSLRVDPLRESDYAVESVPMDTLLGLAQPLVADRTVAFIKLDIEGAERLALRGANAFLDASSAACWIVEINPPALERFETSPRDLVAFFPAAVFERWLIPHYPRHGAKAEPRMYNADETFSDALFYNFVALPSGGPFADRCDHMRRYLHRQ